MAAITGAVIAGASVAASAYGAHKQAGAAKDAAKAQGKAADASIAEQQRQFNLIREDNAPFQQAGAGAVNLQSKLLGVTPYAPPTSAPAPQPLSESEWAAQNPSVQAGGGINGLVASAANQAKGYQNYLSTFNSAPPANSITATPPATGTPDYSSFFKSPDYQFAFDQGTQATERSAAGRGLLGSGNTLAALTQFGQGLATQNYGNYMNRLSALAGGGQTANASNANAGLTTGANVGNALIGAGNTRASGIIDSANAWGDAAGSIAGIAGNYLRKRTQPVYNYDPYSI